MAVSICVPIANAGRRGAIAGAVSFSLFALWWLLLFLLLLLLAAITATLEQGLLLPLFPFAFTLLLLQVFAIVLCLLAVTVHNRMLVSFWGVASTVPLLLLSVRSLASFAVYQRRTATLRSSNNTVGTSHVACTIFMITGIVVTIFVVVLLLLLLLLLLVFASFRARFRFVLSVASVRVFLVAGAIPINC